MSDKFNMPLRPLGPSGSLGALGRLILAISTCLCAVGAQAQGTWPTQPVRVIVPFAAGGGSDIVVRLVQKYLEAELPQPVVVLNRPGAGGVIGNREVRDAKPDGYTILSTHQGMSVNQAVGMADFNYTAFEPIAESGAIDLVVTVPKNSPHRTLQDLVQAARQKPGTISHATNLGSVVHFAMLALAESSSTNFLFVPAGGGGSRLPLMLGGHVDSALMGVAEVIQQYKSGDVKILSILAGERWPALPEVPSSRELGYNFAPLSVGYWWFVPKGTPAQAQANFARALEAVMKRSDVREVFLQRGIRPTFVAGDAFKRQVAQSHDMILALGKKFGVKAN